MTEMIKTSEMIKPRKIAVGDKVAAVSSSWGGPAVVPNRYQIGKRQLQQELGLELVEMKHTLSDPDWIAKNPQARADDLMEAFADPSIKGIFSTIGGDDSIRILPFLDLDVIRANPKIVLGFSDTTVTHFACMKAGLVSFYGTSLLCGFAENGGMFPYAVESLRKTLFSAAAIGVILPATDGWTVEHLDWTVPELQTQKRKLNPSTGWRYLQGRGVVQGKLIGGCIEVVDFLRGTDFWPGDSHWDNAILFLETSEDAPPPIAVTWILRSYAAMGILRRLSGILFGRPGGNVPPEDFVKYDEAILKVVAEEEGLTDMPIITQMDFGHTDPTFVLPYGVLARIDCDKREFAIIENAVI